MFVRGRNTEYLTGYSSNRKSSASDVDVLLDYDGRDCKSLQLAIRLLAPVLLRLADVSLVANLGHALGLGEEFLGLVRISLLDREVTDLTQ